MTPPALFAALPALAGRIGHTSLTDGPTAIEPVGHLPGGTELWVMREDRVGRNYGGNKVRKLEFLLADDQLAQVAGVRTIGAFGSNHVLAVGLYAAHLGRHAEAIVFPQPPSARVSLALRRDLAASLTLHACRSVASLPLVMLARWLATRRGAKPWLYIPGGGSNPRGTLGWWSGGAEIAAQVRAGAVPAFDALYVALGSGGTTAGLWLGLGSAVRALVGVAVVPWPIASAWNVRRLAAQTASLVQGLGVTLPRQERPLLRIDRRLMGAGYGHPTQAAAEALSVAQARGLTLDPTYTAKAFAALLADDAAGRLRGKRVLFLHTYNSHPIPALPSAQCRNQLPAWLAAQHVRDTE